MLRQVHRREVTHDRQARHAGEQRFPLRPDLADDGDSGGDQLERRLEAPSDLRMLVAVSQRHYPKAGARELGQRRPSLDLVVVEFGELRPKRRALGVLVQLRLPALGGDCRSTAGAVDDHYAAGEAFGEVAGQRVAGPCAALPQ